VVFGKSSLPSFANWLFAGTLSFEAANCWPFALYNVNVTGASTRPGFTMAKPVVVRSAAVNDREKFNNDDGVTENGTAGPVPNVVVAVTLRSPNVALDAMVNTAVAEVELIKLTALTAMPTPASTVIGATKSCPVSVTLTVRPGAPLAGVIEVIMGGAVATESV